MDDWEYRPTADFDKSPIDKLRTFPRQPDMFVYALRLALHALMRAWLRIYHRLRIRGREHLPLDRPFVMVANHSSHLDAVCLMSALPLLRIQKSYPAAGKDYFFTSMSKVAFSTLVMNELAFDRRVQADPACPVGNLQFDDGRRITVGRDGARIRIQQLAHLLLRKG